VFWPGIVPVRFSLLEAALDFVEAESARLPGDSFIFNRFHLTLGITMAQEGKASDFHSRYERLINRLKHLDILVFLLQLKEHEIAAKLHLEWAQEELVWKLFLERRLTETPYDTVQELFTAQQELLNRLIKEQGLPYQTGTLEELLGFVASF